MAKNIAAVGEAGDLEGASCFTLDSRVEFDGVVDTNVWIVSRK